MLKSRPAAATSYRERFDMPVTDESSQVLLYDAAAIFDIAAAYAWGDDTEGWEGSAELLSAEINGRARSRQWLVDLFGEAAVGAWEDRAWDAWVARMEEDQ